MKKTISIIILSFAISLFAAETAYAASTILPETTEEDCESRMDEFDNQSKEAQITELQSSAETRSDILGCGIKTGRIHLWMVPYYITYMIEFLIGLVGLISVLFIIIGGYYYAWGGVTEDKEKGKKTVMYALVGMAIAVLAWIIVNIIQTQLTS